VLSVLTLLTTDDECTCHATLAACYQLTDEDRFCASKKGGIGGGGWVSATECHAHCSCLGQL